MSAPPPPSTTIVANVTCKYKTKSKTKSKTKLKIKEEDCPICFDAISKVKISCPNGHSYCEKHVIERAREMYKEGNFSPFNHYGDSEHPSALNCFICRTLTKKAENENFSQPFVKLAELTMCVEISEQRGGTL